MRNLCLAVFILALQLHGQVAQRKSYTFSRQEALDLANQLLQACELDRPDNAYLPLLVKEKITWIYNEAAAKRLEVIYTEDQKNELGAVMMFSGYLDNGHPYLEISARWLLLWVRISGGVASGFNRMQKNSFALSLTHEAVHLEAPLSRFQSKRTQQQFIAEEYRAHRKVDQAVAELIRKNEPVSPDFIDVHKVLVACPQSGTCPAFDKWYVNHLGADNSFMPK